MLLIILVAYPLINLIPVATLAGVMFLVTHFTIESESGIVVLGGLLPLRLRERWGLSTKVKQADMFVMLAVVAVTLTLDLAVAVACGIVIACLVFTWDAGKRVRVDRKLSADGRTVTDDVTGHICFASVKPILELFPSPRDDPRLAIVILEDAEIYDWSGMAFIRQLHDRFESNGTEVHFTQLTRLVRTDL